MKSRTSCSEMSLFRRCLQRYWPFWLGMAAVMALFYVLPLAKMLSDGLRNQVDGWPDRLVQIFVYGHMDTCLLYALLFGLIAAMLVFEHTYSTKLTGLFASLPVKRGRLFWQHWLAGAVMLLSTGLLIALAMLAVEAVYGAADLPSALTFLAVWSMESLTFYSLAAFCVMLTGHVLVIPALYLLLNFAGSALNMMLGGLVTSYSYGVMGGANGLDWLHTLSPVVRLMTECGQGFGPNGESTGFIGWGWVIGYFIVGMIFTALALWLFLRRQNERAQETTAFGVLRPILKYIVTVFFALGFPFLVLYFLGGFSFYGSGAEGARFFPLHLILSLVGARARAGSKPCSPVCSAAPSSRSSGSTPSASRGISPRSTTSRCCSFPSAPSALSCAIRSRSRRPRPCSARSTSAAVRSTDTTTTEAASSCSLPTGSRTAGRRCAGITSRAGRCSISRRRRCTATYSARCASSSRRPCRWTKSM